MIIMMNKKIIADLNKEKGDYGRLAQAWGLCYLKQSGEELLPERYFKLKDPKLSGKEKRQLFSELAHLKFLSRSKNDNPSTEKQTNEVMLWNSLEYFDTKPKVAIKNIVASLEKLGLPVIKNQVKVDNKIVLLPEECWEKPAYDNWNKRYHAFQSKEDEGRRIYVYDSKLKKIVKEIDFEPAWKPAFDNPGKRLILASRDRGYIKVYDCDNWKVVGEDSFDHKLQYPFAAFPDPELDNGLRAAVYNSDDRDMLYIYFNHPKKWERIATIDVGDRFSQPAFVFNGNQVIVQCLGPNNLGLGYPKNIFKVYKIDFQAEANTDIEPLYEYDVPDKCCSGIEFRGTENTKFYVNAKDGEQYALSLGEYKIRSIGYVK